jgi:ammonium transporter, Amt family
LKFKFRYDDALDVVGVHLVGGIVGSLLLRLFADKAVNEFEADDLFLGGGVLGYQLTAVIATLVWSGLITFGIVFVLDLGEHSESGYSFAER